MEGSLSIKKPEDVNLDERPGNRLRKPSAICRSDQKRRSLLGWCYALSGAGQSKRAAFGGSLGSVNEEKR